MTGMDVVNEEDKLKRYIEAHNIKCEHLRFDNPVHTAEEAANATGAPVGLITKSVIFRDANGATVVGLVPAGFRVSVSKLESASARSGLVLTDSDETYKRTGYPAGGVPCFGYEALFVMDPLVEQNDCIYTGGGSEYSLLKITVADVLRLANPMTGKKIRGSKT
jgi:prolyl-tRNA editing enzyme YbaK/EbsC (Cys-tRNA(Pro) deacylase)